MNILVLTRSAWRNDNNIGNTISNIFNGFSRENIYSMCFRSETPQNDIVLKNFCISEKQIMNYLKKGKDLGDVTDVNTNTTKSDQLAEHQMYINAQKHNLMVLWFLRELLWLIAPWKNDKLRQYIDDIKPDIVFMPVFGCWYPHRVLRYIKEYTGAKIVLFHADDNYTMRQFSLSPLYWIYRVFLRKWIRKSVSISDINYAISDIQKIEYENIFKREFKILYKGSKFTDIPQYVLPNEKIKMVFTGNVSSGRYKTLSEIGKILTLINNGSKRIELDIYTLTPLTDKMYNALNQPYINLKGGCESEKVAEIQRNADILVHVEAFDLKNRLAVHQSFSTKIVDYLSMAKCIFAVGPADVASMDYLIKNDAALTATNEAEIEEVLRKVINNKDLLTEYGKKAWECGKRNHQIDKIQNMLYNDFEELLNKDTAIK